MNHTFINNIQILVLETLKMSGSIGTISKEVHVEGFDDHISSEDLKRIIQKESHFPLKIRVKESSLDF